MITLFIGYCRGLFVTRMVSVRPAAPVVVMMLALGAGCAPVGQRYQLLPLAVRPSPPETPAVLSLKFPGRAVTAKGSYFVTAMSPLGGVYYGAWNSCAAARDEMFYEGFRRGDALELAPLGAYADVRPYCEFGLASDGDTILVYGGRTRRGAGLLTPRLHSQVLLLDPEHGTVRRLSPPARFLRGLSRVYFDPRIGSYILEDHRGSAYRLRIP